MDAIKKYWHWILAGGHLFLRSGCIAGIAGTDLCGNL